MRRRRKRITYDPDTDYYSIMGVPPIAPPDTIRQAYRQRAKEVHPDINPDQRAWATDAFQQLAEAYSVLIDPEQRARYDSLRLTYQTAARKPHVPVYQPPPRPTIYRVEKVQYPRFSGAWVRHKTHVLWRWRWAVFWALAGIVAVLWGASVIFSREHRHVHPPPPPPPPDIVWGETSGCQDQAWTIISLEPELDAQNAISALQVKGSAVTMFTVELYQDTQRTPLQGTPVRNPAYTDSLARFDTYIQRDARYTVWLRAIDESRPACRVTFWLQ